MIPFKFFPSPVSTTDPKYSAKYSQKMKKVTPIEKKTKRQPKGRFDQYA
jgi:hypothetical protein|tara:strand:+ start:1755 stop:1901 length:147 start_codon:yes stop_codon:yes gene_type:complete